MQPAGLYHIQSVYTPAKTAEISTLGLVPGTVLVLPTEYFLSFYVIGRRKKQK